MTDHPSRSKTVVRAGALFIATNFSLAVLNFVAGILSNSLAVVSNAVHNLIDSTSGFVVVISEKLATSRHFLAHRAKIERIATILVALIIIAVGAHLIIEAVEKIITPEPAAYSPLALVILVVSLVAKYALAIFLNRTGQKLGSSVITASGAETMNDVWISLAVLTSALIYLIFGVDIEAYLTLAISVVIIKIGIGFIFPRLSHHHHHHF